MQKLTQETFQTLLEQSPISRRMKREVRFASSVASLSDDAWAQTELLPITDRSENKGVLLVQFNDDAFYAASFELSRGITSSTGRAQAIICDFCRTWQTGSRSGSITLQKPGRDTGSITFLCCADLECSKHVRSLTSASKTSRAQLREDMDTNQRVARLKSRLEEVMKLLGLTPLTVPIKD